MKRFRTILLYLLLGAIINVAVAWGLCNFGSPPRGKAPMPRPCSQFEHLWIQHVGESPAFRVAWERVDWSLGINQVTSTLELDESERQTRSLRVAHYGLPLKSLYCWSHGHVYESGVPTPNQVLGGAVQFAEPGRATAIRRAILLPYFVDIGPFAFNSVFFAALLYGPFAILRWIRRDARVQAGRCIQCAHNLRHADHAACPECGHEIPGATTA